MQRVLIIFFLLSIANCKVSAQCLNDIFTGYGGTKDDKGQTIISDSLQNVYLTGCFTDTIQLGAFVLTTDSIGQFLCKISPSGNVIWAKNLFNSNSNYFSNFPPIIRINHSRQLVMAGTCQMQNASFDTIQNAFSNGDLYIAKFDAANGVLNSFVSTGRHLYTYIYDMDIDLTDNIYVTGSFVGVINFGVISLICSGQTNSFIAKFNSLNQAMWANRVTTFPNTSGNVAFSLNHDNYNHVFISGWFGLNAGFGNGVTLNSPVTSNGFIAKYDVNGNIEWAKASDTSTTFNQQIIMDTSSITVVQTSPAKLIDYNQNGDTIWTKTISNNAYGLFSEVKKFNNKYLGMGGFYNSMNLDGTSYSSAGYNFFIAYFNLSGGVDWVRIIQSTNAFPNNMSFDQQNNIYLTGAYSINNLISQTTVIPTWGGTDILYTKLCNAATSSGAEFSEDNSISIYPNPAQDFITVNAKHNKKITILNLLGEIILEENFLSNKIENVQLDISTLSSGIYFIKVGDEVRKFLKQ